MPSTSAKYGMGLYVLGAYLLLVQVVLPLLAPLRSLGVIEPGEIRNQLLPPLFLLMIISFGGFRVLGFKTLLHIGLAFTFVQAMLIGIQNIMDPDRFRSYFSHLFQISSAYVMLSVGWLSVDRIGHRFWERFVALALGALLISTFFTVTALGRDEIGRLYTPAYGFIFVAAFSSIYSKSNSALTLGGLLLSNKRGPILAVALIFIQHQWNSLVAAGPRRASVLVKNIIHTIVMISGVAIATIIIVNWASAPGNEDTAVGRAVNITFGRLVDVVEAEGSKSSLDEIAAGRFEEINTALDSLGVFSFLMGSGAGWEITLSGGKTVQNIHFSPLSLVSVFGLPFTVFLYGYLISLVIRSMRRRGNINQLSTTEKMAPLYLSGALLHSIFAYSLFIDWLVFFFAGVLSKSLKTRAHVPVMMNKKDK